MADLKARLADEGCEEADLERSPLPGALQAPHDALHRGSLLRSAAHNAITPHPIPQQLRSTPGSRGSGVNLTARTTGGAGRVGREAQSESSGDLGDAGSVYGCLGSEHIHRSHGERTEPCLERKRRPRGPVRRNVSSLPCLGEAGWRTSGTTDCARGRSEQARERGARAARSG